MSQITEVEYLECPICKEWFHYVRGHKVCKMCWPEYRITLMKDEIEQLKTKVIELEKLVEEKDAQIGKW